MTIVTTPIFEGPEFLVPTTVLDNQYESTITSLSDGRFVVAWSDLSRSGGDLEESAVRAQIFEADGTPSGNEFLVNSITEGSQSSSTIAGLANGGFVVSWEDSSRTSGNFSLLEIKAQIFDSNGAPVGNEFLVNTTTEHDQRSPHVVALTDGRFLISWTDESETGLDTTDSAIRAQIFNADGSISGSEILVNSTHLDDQTNSHATALPDGGFVITWEDNSATAGDTDNTAVRAQVFNSSGERQAPEILVNTATSGRQDSPAVTTLSDGQFVITWTDESRTGDDNSSTAIRAQVFTAFGHATGPELLMNTTTSSGQFAPEIAALPDGRFVITWTDISRTGEDTSIMAIRAQVFDAEGFPSGPEFIVNTTTLSAQILSHVTVLEDGNIAFVWRDEGASGGDTSGFAVRAQIVAVPTFEAISDAATDARLLGADSHLAVLPGASLTGFFEAAVMSAGTDTSVFVDGTVVSGGLGDFPAIQLDTALDGYGGHSVSISATGVVRAASDTAILLAGSDNRVDNAGQIIGDVALGDDAGMYSATSDGSVAGQVIGGDGDDTMLGAAADDHFTAGRGDDSLVGRSGSDTLDGGNLGEDTLRGGGGDDALAGGANSDRILGGSGNDTIDGGTGADSINGDSGDDLIFGGSSFDTINGGSGNDTIEAGENADLVLASSGDDFVRGDSGSDTIEGGSGDDTISASTGNDLINGGSGNDRMFGSSDNDTVLGSLGDDLLDGGLGNDSLRGGSDDDTLNGGLGQDTLSGGSGADVFVFDDVADSVQGTTTRDLVLDFETGVDQIDLSGVATGLTYIGETDYTGTANEVRYNAAIGRLYIDIDGDSASDFAIDLVGDPALTEDDLILL